MASYNLRSEELENVLNDLSNGMYNFHIELFGITFWCFLSSKRGDAGNDSNIFLPRLQEH